MFKFVLLMIFSTRLIVFAADDGDRIIDIDDQDKDSYEEYMAFEGRIIKQINLRLLDISGPSVNEGESTDTSWLGNIGNSLHYKTREWVVRNSLLFTVGDSLDPDKLSESERLLRSSGFFLDARIKVTSYPGISDSVTIDVITQDRWTFTFLFSYDSRNQSSYTGFRDDNLLGLGHMIDAVVTYDEDPSIGLGGTIKYNAMNVAGTFINAGAILEANKNYKEQTISLTRPYLSTLLNWAGGLSLTFEQGLYEYVSEQQLPVSIPYKLNMQDIWAGKSFPFWFGPKIFRQKTRIIASARISRINHSERPSVAQGRNRLFQNYTQYLTSFGVINQRFYKDIFLAGFGVTEDVPVGGYFSFTTGSETREFNDRWYIGFDAVYSKRVEKAGYFSGRLAMGGFRHHENWEQAALNLNFLYHSPLFISNSWKYRLMFTSDLLYGFNRFEGEQIYLDGMYGLRGFNRYSLQGTKRIYFNSEALIFSPYAPLGFVLGGIVFADMGVIAGSRESILNTTLYQAYGFGLRISNESIARSTFGISLVYNPSLPAGQVQNNKFKIVFTGSLVLGSRPFSIEKPALIPFNGVR